MLTKHSLFHKEQAKHCHYAPFLNIVELIEKYYEKRSKTEKLPDIFLDYYMVDSKVPKNTKRIVISGESMFMKYHFPRYNNFFIRNTLKLYVLFRYFILSRIKNFLLDFNKRRLHLEFDYLFYNHFLHNAAKIKRILKIMGFKTSTIPLYHRKRLQDYVFRIEKKHRKSKNDFAIICNDIKHPNILNFPYFFYTCFGRFEELIKIKKENLYTEKKKFCAFIVARTYAIDRIKFFEKLSKYKKVDSYGPVLNNAKIPLELLKKYAMEGITDEELKNAKNHTYILRNFKLNSELFREYKFVICFENSYAGDYVTEKLPNVMLGNAIGIYRGAPNVGEFFNTKSFLNWDDFGSDEKVIEKIIELDKDDKKYQKMLQEPFFVNQELPPRVKNLEKVIEK